MILICYSPEKMLRHVVSHAIGSLPVTYNNQSESRHYLRRLSYVLLGNRGELTQFKAFSCGSRTPLLGGSFSVEFEFKKSGRKKTS